MSQMARTSRTRTFLGKIVGKLFQLMSDVGGNKTLFLDILVAPTQVVLVFHGTSQCYGLPLVPIASQENLWSGNQPEPALRCIDQGYHHSGIMVTGTLKQLHRRFFTRPRNDNAARENQLLEVAIAQVGMEIGKVQMIVCGNGGCLVI